MSLILFTVVIESNSFHLNGILSLQLNQDDSSFTSIYGLIV
jgi:hypothetical protein